MAKGGAAAAMVTLAAVVVVMVMVVTVPHVSCHRYIVGPADGWTTNVDYNAWSRSIDFYVGDWLFFVHENNMMNVVEVNKTDFEKCNSDHPLHNWTTGSKVDVVPLHGATDYYFISGNDFCDKGMKVALHVGEINPPPASSPPKTSPSPSPSPSPLSIPPPSVSPQLSPALGSPAPQPDAGARDGEAQKSNSPALLPNRIFIAFVVIAACGAFWDFCL